MGEKAVGKKDGTRTVGVNGSTPVESLEAMVKRHGDLERELNKRVVARYPVGSLVSFRRGNMRVSAHAVVAWARFQQGYVYLQVMTLGTGKTRKISYSDLDPEDR
jgi:hypothetical protein